MLRVKKKHEPTSAKKMYQRNPSSVLFLTSPPAENDCSGSHSVGTVNIIKCQHFFAKVSAEVQNAENVVQRNT